MTTKNKILLIASLSAAFIACKKGEPPAPAAVKTATAKLVGTWHVVSDTTTSDWNLTRSESVSVYTGTASDYYTFNSNGTFSWKQDGGTSSGSYSVNNKQLTVVDASEPSGQNTRVWSVTQLTDHTAVFNMGLASPGGAISETITLSK